MVATVLGMDPLNFALAIISALGALFSFLNFVRQIMPTVKFLEIVDMLIETRTLWKEFEQNSSLTHKQMDQLFDIMDSLEDDVESFIYVARPTKNVWTILRAWFHTWSLIRLGNDIDKLRMGLLTLNSHRSNIERSIKRMAMPDSPFVDLNMLERRYSRIADAFIFSFAGRKSTRSPSTTDLEANVEPGTQLGMINLTPPTVPPLTTRSKGGPRFPRRKPDYDIAPTRRAQRPISSRSSISINSSQDTLVAAEPVVHESQQPLLRFPHMLYPPTYEEKKQD